MLLSGMNVVKALAVTQFTFPLSYRIFKASVEIRFSEIVQSSWLESSDIRDGHARRTTLKATGVFFPFISWKHMGRISFHNENGRSSSASSGLKKSFTVWPSIWKELNVVIVACSVKKESNKFDS